MPLRYSLRMDGEPDYLIKLAGEAEAAGFDRLWASEGEQSALPALAFVAGHTRQIGLATGITLGFVRSPMDTARSALQINRYAQGRFVLGLGTGDKRVVESSFGMPFSPPAARLRECIQLVRTFLEALPLGNSFAHEGTYYRVRHAAHRKVQASDFPTPPIHIGALGPAMATVAGEVADGLLCHVLNSPAWLRDTVWPAIRRGQERGNRQGSPFELTATVICAIHDDLAQARWDARRSLAVYGVRPAMGKVFERHGFGALAAQMWNMLPVEAAKLIPDEMVECFCAVGSVDDVRRAVSRFEGIANGVRVLPPPHVLSTEEDWAYQEKIIETFGT